MKLHESFNRSGVSKFLNSPAGRIFRIVMGIFFITVGYMYRTHALGIFSIVWGALAFIAGSFDICFFSVALGGPLSGKQIRNMYK